MKDQVTEITAQEYFSEINSHRTTAPIYALIGADMYYMGKVLQSMISKFVDAASRDFDYIQYYGDELKNDSYMEQLDMLPFMANKRVVIIRDVDKIEAEHLLKLPAYLKNPSQEVILIMTAEKIDSRTIFGKEINQHAFRIICKEPRYSSDIKNWLSAELNKRKIRMDTQARTFFCDTVQIDYCAALNELEKIIILNNDTKDVISLQDVKSALGIARSNTIFELKDSLGAKNCAESLGILENMLQNDEEPIKIIYMLTGFYQQLWKVLALLKNNMSQNEIIKRYMYDVYPSFREKVVSFAKNYSLSQIRRIFELLMEADTDLKSANLKKYIIMDLLIYKICNPAARI